MNSIVILAVQQRLNTETSNIISMFPISTPFGDATLQDTKIAENTLLFTDGILDREKTRAYVASLRVNSTLPVLFADEVQPQ